MFSLQGDKSVQTPPLVLVIAIQLIIYFVVMFLKRDDLTKMPLATADKSAT